MMKSKFRLSAMLSPLWVALLALLGYSCENNADMYGTPYGEWEIKGEVTDEDNKPVADARILVIYPEMNSSQFDSPEFEDCWVMTDKSGRYISENGGFPSTLKVVCIPDDPVLRSDSTMVELKYSGKKKKDPWNWGSAKATVDFKLKKKE
ncbi:MAG: radical SAM-associated putative lipoprotein [Muribaculaceae bacterium]|nr:radical SAM-associated putative lipoprotein [Muribaculaceae bacterium]